MLNPQARLVYDIPILGPIGVAVSNLGTVSQQVIGADAVRHGIIFHNPGAQNVRVMPANVAPVSGAGGILIYPESEETIYGGGYVNVNCAWNAVADGGSNNPLTIFNFTNNNNTVPAPNALSQLKIDVAISSPSGIQISNLATASQQVIGFNAVRRGIRFMNPNAGVPIWICPANLVAVAGAGSMKILPGAEKTIIANGNIRVNCAWNAIADSGSGNYLTILEFL